MGIQLSAFKALAQQIAQSGSQNQYVSVDSKGKLALCPLSSNEKLSEESIDGLKRLTDNVNLRFNLLDEIRTALVPPGQKRGSKTIENYLQTVRTKLLGEDKDNLEKVGQWLEAETLMNVIKDFEAQEKSQGVGAFDFKKTLPRDIEDKATQSQRNKVSQFAQCKAGDMGKLLGLKGKDLNVKDFRLFEKDGLIQFTVFKNVKEAPANVKEAPAKEKKAPAKERVFLLDTDGNVCSRDAYEALQRELAGLPKLKGLTLQSFKTADLDAAVYFYRLICKSGTFTADLKVKALELLADRLRNVHGATTTEEKVFKLIEHFGLKGAKEDELAERLYKAVMEGIGVKREIAGTTEEFIKKAGKKISGGQITTLRALDSKTVGELLGYAKDEKFTFSDFQILRGGKFVQFTATSGNKEKTSMLIDTDGSMGEKVAYNRFRRELQMDSKEPDKLLGKLQLADLGSAPFFYRMIRTGAQESGVPLTREETGLVFDWLAKNLPAVRGVTASETTTEEFREDQDNIEKFIELRKKFRPKEVPNPRDDGKVVDSLLDKEFKDVRTKFAKAVLNQAKEKANDSRNVGNGSENIQDLIDRVDELDSQKNPQSGQLPFTFDQMMKARNNVMKKKTS